MPVTMPRAKIFPAHLLSALVVPRIGEISDFLQLNPALEFHLVRLCYGRRQSGIQITDAGNILRPSYLPS